MSDTTTRCQSTPASPGPPEDTPAAPLSSVVASAWRAEVERGTCWEAQEEASGDGKAAPCLETLSADPPPPTFQQLVGDFAVLVVAALLGIGALALILAHGSVALEVMLLVVAVVMLGAGHALLLARRRERACEAAARRARLESALRAQVAASEVQQQRLATFAEMAAQIAHEIRNPLASIVLNAELLRDEVHACEHASPEARRLATAVCNEAERLSELTHEYLAFARLPRIEAAPHRIEDLVDEVARFCRSEAERAGVRLVLDTVASAPALVDAKLVRQVLLNLVRNALEALPGGGTVTLRTGSEDGLVLVDVVDTGEGVPTPLAEAIFNPFFSTKPRGTGLGLSVARKIAREHGGDLLLLPSSRGAWFRLQLPAAGGTPPPAQARTLACSAPPAAAGPPVTAAGGRAPLPAGTS